MNESAVFEIWGAEYSLALMLDANQDDPDFCEWAKSAKLGPFADNVYFKVLNGSEALADEVNLKFAECGDSRVRMFK